MNIHYKSRGKHDVPGTAFLSIHINVVDPTGNKTAASWVKTDYYVWLPDGIKHRKDFSISAGALKFNYTLLEKDSKQMVIKDIFYRS